MCVISKLRDDFDDAIPKSAEGKILWSSSSLFSTSILKLKTRFIKYFFEVIDVKIKYAIYALINSTIRVSGNGGIDDDDDNDENKNNNSTVTTATTTI